MLFNPPVNEKPVQILKNTRLNETLEDSLHRNFTRSRPSAGRCNSQISPSVKLILASLFDQVLVVQAAMKTMVEKRLIEVKIPYI